MAPATAHWLGAMANGLAADTVTATCLATDRAVVVAPAMDGEMWNPPGHASQRRGGCARFGYKIVDPEEGPLASGRRRGQVAEPSTIVERVVEAADRPIRAPDERLQATEGGRRP